jgi:hypothetical protein
METYKYVISQIAHDNIYSFYSNVSKKYSNTYSYELMLSNIEDAFNSMYKIENGLLRRTPTIQRWEGYFMANTDKWYFAYRIDGDTIYVEDACHAQNMHESKKQNIFSLILEFQERLNRIK